MTEANSISGRNILIIATDGFEQSELEVPRDMLSDAGANVRVASLDGEDICGWDDGDWGDEVSVDLTIAQASVDDYDALVLPGGQMNPDTLRHNDDVLRLIRDFASAQKPVAAICHAPWLLIEAGLSEGRRMTSYASIQTDVKNSGATFVDESVVVDGHIITSRNPDDLPDFCEAIIEALQSTDAKTSG